MIIQKATVGDVIVFEFRQKNHTMTQSSFSKPCTATSGGFDTGFLPVPQNQTSSFPIKTFVVEKTDPYWMYCAQATHCQEGMVFAINPGNNFSSFQENALALAAPSTMTTVTSTVTVENAGQTVTVTVTSQSSPTGSNSTTASDASSSSANLSKNGAKALVVDGSTVSVLVSVLALMLGTVM
ncbi:hypothetical protein SCHPADRAFT_832198 [Schizopora paradoxa]|uniref:Phytocyanin domain-containing protein n=1 Tax=Schizopora paradoxa TaxID=27342 RepID=A0A0H2RMG6_9AGAM|nr:hypothetical protein SCHPADRAFT_832198 [Schizopora paradoxa]